MNAVSGKYRLTVKSTTSELGHIRDFIQKIADENKLDAKTVAGLILAVDEASTNIVKHAYHYSNDKEIIIELTLDNGVCTVTLTDFGDSFDLDSIPNPDMKDYLEKRKVGGLGIFLMRTLLDKVEYFSDHSAGNKLVLVKNFQ